MGTDLYKSSRILSKISNILYLGSSAYLLFTIIRLIRGMFFVNSFVGNAHSDEPFYIDGADFSVILNALGSLLGVVGIVILIIILVMLAVPFLMTLITTILGCMWLKQDTNIRKDNVLKIVMSILIEFMLIALFLILGLFVEKLWFLFVNPYFIALILDIISIKKLPKSL